MTTALAEAPNPVAGCYLRISSDPEGRRAGVERQREDVIAECARRGWTPVVFEDNDVSAYSGKKRPQYEKMLAAVQAGQVQAVVAWAPDRLHRSPVELERFIDIVNAAAADVVTVKGGDVNLSTGDGRMVARIVGAIARGEVEKMSDRMKRQRLQAAQQGKPNPGGRRPYGFMADKITHNPMEADALRQAARDLIAGRSLKSVTAELGFPTTVAFKRCIMSPRMAGLRMAGGKEVPAVWEPIIPEEDWRVLCSILKAPQRHPGVQPRRYLLSGFLRCAVCDAKMHSNPTLGARRYACPNDHVIRQAEMLEAHVTDEVLAALESPDLFEALHAADDDEVDMRAVAADIDRLEARLSQAKTAWLVDGLISKADFVAAKADLEAQLAEKRTMLAARAGAAMSADLPIGTARIRAAWESGSLQQRRELIGVVVDRIVVHKAGKGARRIDPATVQICWR